MPPDSQRRFAFASAALAEDTFEVVSFTGEEALSALYAFDLVLVSTRDDIDPEQVIGAAATLTLHGQDGPFAYHGLACVFEQTGKTDDFAFYRVRLVPRPHLLTLGENNRIFLDKPVNEFLTEALRLEGLTPGLDFELRLSKSYPKRPYVSQFRETTYAFACRWMERDGLYFFFEQSPAGAKMVITDTKAAHQPLPGKSELRYDTPSGLAPPDGAEAVFDFRRRLRPVPASVLLTDWNYETPSVDLTAQAPVLPEQGRGSMRLFGDHFRTIAEGRDLAAIRAEELLCRRDMADGKTSFPGLRAGYRFTLTNHFADACNRPYLVTAVRHEGRQFAFLTAGLGLAHEPDGRPETYYRNALSAMPAEVQFRPERATPWPRLEGLVSAFVDGAGSETYAEVDDQGRYKVKLAYDRSGRENGKASAWVRMAQPYGGADHGLHFPLHKGCEVALACHDGDPDRPIILGALPNPDHKSVVTSANQTRVNLQTCGENQLYFEDKTEASRALLQSTSTQTFLRLGTPNDPFPNLLDFSKMDDEKKGEKGIKGIAFSSPYGITAVCGSMLTTYLIGYFDSIVAKQSLTAVLDTSLVIGLAQDIVGKNFEANAAHGHTSAQSQQLTAKQRKIAANKTRLIDQIIAARGRIDTLSGDVQQLQATLDELNGKVDVLAGQVTDLAQETSEVTAENSVLVGQKNKLLGQVEELNAQVDKMAQSNIASSAEVKTVLAQETALEEAATRMDARRTETMGELSQMGAEMSHNSELDLTF